jgi:hypothetical protein
MLAPPCCCRRYAIQSSWHTRWQLSIRSQKVVSSSESASLPMCRIFARSSLQRVCLSKSVSDAYSKVCGSPVRCGAGNRSIGMAGGKSSTVYPWPDTISSRWAPDLDWWIVRAPPAAMPPRRRAVCREPRLGIFLARWTADRAIDMIRDPFGWDAVGYGSVVIGTFPVRSR